MTLFLAGLLVGIFATMGALFIYGCENETGKD
jgi:hypothetical protein